MNNHTDVIDDNIGSIVGYILAFPDEVNSSVDPHDNIIIAIYSGMKRWILLLSCLSVLIFIIILVCINSP